MTIVNDMVQDNTGSLAVSPTDMIDNVPWRVIPATAIAAGIFYGIEQLNAGVAKALAALAFVTAFVSSIDQSTTSLKYHSPPLGTLLKITGDTSGASFNRG